MERIEEKPLQNDESGEKFLREVDDKTASISEEVSNMEKCSDCRKLKQQYDLLHEEQVEIKRLLEDVRQENELKSRECHEIKRLLEVVRQENELKSRECHEAWTSLHELRTELMRKSMHVGSLAFAVEGQVQEKSRWFQSLEEMNKKFKLLKTEHAKLSEEALEYKRSLADMTQLAKTIQSTVDHHVHLEREHKDVKFKYSKETKERKDLYNQIVEMKGNIRVFCRCRPLNLEEIEAGASMAFDFDSAKDGELTLKSSHGSSKKNYKFDSVFGPEDNQEMVFQKTSPLVVSVLDGYNVCIFAYGQTGTGKTFTMEGTEEARGVNYRTLEELFRVIKEREGVFKYELTVNVLEVYNEQIRDLLVPESQSGVAAKRLEVRQVAEGVHYVPGLVDARVSNMSEVWEVLQTGSKARAVGATNANEHSSRSHCILCVMVRGENLVNGECTRSKLWLIDLSGSERVAKTDAQGERLKEAQSINKSLSALGDVISSLATKSPHIPFRNSKLTHLLQDSLGGDSKTLMFVQISPNENDVGETLCSLNFASRVRGIELGPAKKQVDGYKLMVEKVKQDIKNKDGQIRKMEETVHSLDVKNKAKDLINKNLQEKVKALESQLLIERKLARQHVDAKIAEKHKEKQEESPYTSFCTDTEHQNYAIRPPLMETNGNKLDNSILRNFPFPKDKENKPELADEKPQRNFRKASLYPTAPPEFQIFPSFRHKSLIPFSKKAGRVSVATPSTPVSGSGRESEYEGSERKLNGVLRQSLQKNLGIRPPLPQTVKRRTLSGLENVRVSIGGSGRMARRVVVRDGTKNAERLGVRKWEDVERRWNYRTAARNVF